MPLFQPSVTAPDLEMKNTCWVTLQLNHMSHTVQVLSRLSQTHGNADKGNHFQLFFPRCHLYSTLHLAMSDCTRSILIKRGKSLSPSFKCSPNEGLLRQWCFQMIFKISPKVILPQWLHWAAKKIGLLNLLYLEVTVSSSKTTRMDNLTHLSPHKTTGI